jgi:hypothetical protein
LWIFSGEEGKAGKEDRDEIKAAAPMGQKSDVEVEVGGSGSTQLFGRTDDQPNFNKFSSSAAALSLFSFEIPWVLLL